MYQKLLVPLDGSALAESALPHALALARGCNIPQMWLLQAVELIPITEGTTEAVLRIQEQRKAEGQAYLAKKAQELAQQGVQVQTHLEEGPPAEVIARFVERNGIDLIAMVTHGRSGIGRWVFGSVADRVLRSARVPILLVRAKGGGGSSLI